MQGYYHSIEHFGTVDGQGIRYVLFLSGCQLRCRFCHNPDTWQQGCQSITTEQILKDLLHYRHFYDASSGGITASGGEPLLQSQFLAELFSSCQSHNIHTTIDTAGYYDQKHLTAVLPYTNAALFSIKAVDPQKHRWLAGFDNQQILENLNYVAQSIPITLRYVIIPGLTNSLEDLQALAGLVHTLPALVPVELLPYHSLGRHKWKTLNMKYTLDDVPDATTQDIVIATNILKSEGIIIV
ncbi:pyruvate formate-lyase-activating protein [Pelosinus baikalensis]|uniref:Pyruvate formate-lyase-activating enzyme n=1 Tax=Pelosinus baikalensis TaxID=2892015 RepID=A0ABS8HNG7_9FIRM|nr:pyruvate formate-lyase-activating protein [Pelosinus baikalensis]MCC5463823.1 pyruvate formate lyase-activating protein [Pelosinus baikalensis]